LDTPLERKLATADRDGLLHPKVDLVAFEVAGGSRHLLDALSPRRHDEAVASLPSARVRTGLWGDGESGHCEQQESSSYESKRAHETSVELEQMSLLLGARSRLPPESYDSEQHRSPKVGHSRIWTGLHEGPPGGCECSELTLVPNRS